VECQQCGQKFELKVKWQKFCSRLCSDKWWRLHRRDGNYPAYRCRYCGKTFVPKVADRVTYCSRECYFQSKHDRKEALAEARAILREQRSKENNAVCKLCGRGYRAKRAGNGYCSDACRKEIARRKQRERENRNHVARSFICKQCGKEVAVEYPNKAKRFCSSKCARRFAGASRNRLYGRNHRERARRFGVEYEPIKPIEIFERDNWHCRICGRETPKELRGTIRANAPELDHIIPMSLGGGHVALNVQCVCRRCNIEKSNKDRAQLILV